MAKKKSTPGVISNRRARFDYALDDSLVVGVELNGRETRSLRQGHAHLRGAFVTLKNNELWLMGATITGTSSAIIDSSEQTRTRKLLAKKREIAALDRAKDTGKTILPLEFLTRGRYIKLRIAAGRGKKQYDKREVLRKREEQRRIDAAL